MLKKNMIYFNNMIEFREALAEHTRKREDLTDEQKTARFYYYACDSDELLAYSYSVNEKVKLLIGLGESEYILFNEFGAKSKIKG